MINSADEFVRLRFSDDLGEQEMAAREDAPVEVWKEVITRFPEARVWVARNKTIPDDIIILLASDADRQVRSAIAMKGRLTPELLERLSQDSYDAVRLHVAMHRKTSRATLERLAADPWPRVREEAARRLANLG